VFNRLRKVVDRSVHAVGEQLAVLADRGALATARTKARRPPLREVLLRSLFVKLMLISIHALRPL